ncbi:hypothetical protein AVEN_268974-1 [Araneus ventricosus]|uniref:Uncharacterized protein n=1 Tax=Araneus ventricosus TaxID=182803 RepID=A0A4Y2I1Z6_ARAVE|nr:hypothetical protein AVEN_268974-1 [Araneus ventricosus]
MLDIHGRTFKYPLERVAPDRTSFQTIHLGGSFTKAPCKRHNRLLRSFRDTVPTTPPAFSRERHSSPLFCGFRFCERSPLSLTPDCISVYGPAR